MDLHLTVGEVAQGGAVDLVVVEGAQVLRQPQETQPIGHIKHAPLCSHHIPDSELIVCGKREEGWGGPALAAV